MFGDESPTHWTKVKSKNSVNVGHDEEADDKEGYYRFRLGDMLNNRYSVFAFQGRGVFSTVLRVRDTAYGNRELVIKILRHQETMKDSGLRELEFLKTLAAKDPENKKHCVRMMATFEHRGHLCLVFEALHMNLREVVKKLGGQGLNIKAVRSFAKQMFTGLRHLKKCNILHGDIKPDNILVNSTMQQVKICDLGSAGLIDKCDITPYLVSRYYRPPEVILGMQYNEAVDMWSIGCVLYELYTGKILFNGNDNNEMIQMCMEFKGPFPGKKLRKAQFYEKYFTSDLLFKKKNVDPLTKAIMTTKTKIVKPTKDLYKTMKGYLHSDSSDYEKQKLQQLADLLEKMFILDYERRISVDQALYHPFLNSE